MFQGSDPSMTAHAPSARTDPETARQAQRFGRARAVQAAILIEDYVELIAELAPQDGTSARITDIARRLGISHASVVKSVARLRREGLAESRPHRGVTLTEAGRAMAERVRARHLLVVELLCAVGVPAEVAATDAEGIEHHVSDATLGAFRRFLATRHAVEPPGQAASGCETGAARGAGPSSPNKNGRSPTASPSPTR
jgi:DtxR family transcriptional regulator, manganese transport regulator